MDRTHLGNLPLSEVFRPEIALSLQHLLKVHTVGGFLDAWRDDARRPRIELLFDSLSQAQQAAATCSLWAGEPSPLPAAQLGAWWRGEG